MKRSIIAAMAALLMASTAQAETVSKDGITSNTLYSTGKSLWRVEKHTYADGRVDQCTMGTGWGERNNNAKSYFYIKFNVDTGVYWAFGKSTWRMKAGNEVRSIIAVDNDSWSGTAVVQSTREGVAAPFASDQADKFLAALRSSNKLSILFPNSAETPFIVQIDKKALDAWEKCSANLIADSGPEETAPQEEQQKPTTDTPLGGPKYRGA